MVDRIERAREAVERASEATENSTVREQLHSIDEGLKDLEGNEVAGADRKQAGDRFQQVEKKLAGLVDDVDGAAREYIEEARDHVDVHRQEVTRDW